MNALLLTVYFLVVFYVLYQMALSLEDQQEEKVFIHLDEAFAEEQTQMQLSSQLSASHINAKLEQVNFGSPDKPSNRSMFALTFDSGKPVPTGSPDVAKLRSLGMSNEDIKEMLKSRIFVRVSPVGKQPVIEIRFVSIDITNKTADTQMYLDWDRSSLAMYGQGNRIIRSTSSLASRDLSQPQVFGVVNPGQSIRFEVNIERNYTRDPATGLLKQPMPIANLKAIVEKSQLTDPTKSEKNIQDLYGLDLMVRLKKTSEPDSKMINLLMPFAFTLEIKVDEPAFPPLRWLLRNFGRRSRSQGSWLWGTKKAQAK